MNTQPNLIRTTVPIPIRPTIPIPIRPTAPIPSNDSDSEGEVSSDSDSGDLGFAPNIDLELNHEGDSDSDENDDSDEEELDTGTICTLVNMINARPVAPRGPTGQTPITPIMYNNQIPSGNRPESNHGLRLNVVAPRLPTNPIVQTVTPVTTLKLGTSPNISQLQGLIQVPQTMPPQPTIATLPPRSIPKTVDVEAILSKMPGISVTAVAPSQVPADINDYVRKEADETPEDFEARRRITLKLSSIPDYKLNNTTAVVAGSIMMRKAKLGLTYDPDVEAAISYLTALLQR